MIKCKRNSNQYLSVALNRFKIIIHLKEHCDMSIKSMILLQLKQKHLHQVNYLQFQHLQKTHNLQNFNQKKNYHIYTNYSAAGTIVDSFSILLLVLIFVFRTYSKSLNKKKFYIRLRLKLKRGQQTQLSSKMLAHKNFGLRWVHDIFVKLVILQFPTFKLFITIFEQVHLVYINFIRFPINLYLNIILKISMSSMKKPFGKIGMKLGKKQNIDDKKIQDNQQQKEVSKAPKFKLESNKPKKNIYDAVRKIDQQKPQEQEHQNKPVLNLKPSFKRNKLGKNETPTNQNNNSQELNNQSKQDNQESQRRAPLFNRYKNRGLGEKSKQKVVIQEPQEQNSNEYERYDKNQREIGQSNNFDVNQDHQQEQKHHKLMKPNMKIKKGSSNTKLTPKLNSQRTQVFQQYKEANKQNPTPYSMAQMLNIQATQINISKKPQQISGDKIKKQQKRAHELSKLLNLQIDLYEQVLSISSVTSFQVYINKIKGGFLKNSSDQAFDQKVSDSCQTLTFQYVDFSNQCPEDYQGISHQDDSEQNFNSFLLGISPIIEQLIKPTQNITMPPTSLLAFRPTFRYFIKCPNPAFIYYSEEWNISILVIGQKLYIAEGEIQSVLNLGGSILSGLRNGKIVLWNGQNDRGSLLYYKIKETIQSKNFELPSFVTNETDKLSPYVCEGSIKSLIASLDQSIDFYSLDQNAKMIKWRLQQRNNKKIIITGKQSIDFSNLIQKKYLIGYSIKKRNQIFYILTSFGLLCWNGQEIVKKIQVGHVRQFYLPKRSTLIFVVSQFNKILIFNETLTSQIFELKIKTDEEITEIIIPEIQHQNQVISIFYHIYLIGKNGGIYELNLLQNQIQQVSLTNAIASKKKIKDDSDDQNEGQPIKSKRQKGLIYNGVNLIGNKLQTIKLLQDLKYSTSQIRLTINMQRSVPNLKNILNCNKQLISFLQQKSMILV